MKQGWEKKLIKDVVIDLHQGLNTAGYKIKFYDTGYPIIQTRNLENGVINLDEKMKFMSKEDWLIYKNKYKPSIGDVFLTNIGTIGKTAVVTEEQDYLIHWNIFIFKVDKKIIDPYYLKTFLDTPFCFEYYLSNQKGGTVNFITKKMIEVLEIPLPPLPEQQRIVSILDEAFAAIANAKANAEQNLKNAKELFDVYLHKYYTNKEEGWESKNLKEVAEYFNGLTYSPKDVSNEGIIVLRSSNVQNDELDFDDIVRVNATVKEKIIVQDGDILMCSRNGSARLVGKTATIKNLNERMTFGTFMMIIRSQYNPYLSWFFKSTDFRNQIKGGENTMINQITRYMLDDVVLSFPPIDKQNEIVQKLDALSLKIKKLDIIYNQKLVDLEELKKSVLQKAFSGELKIETVEI